MYTEDQKREISLKYFEAVDQLQSLQIRLVNEGKRSVSRETHEYLVHGVARRTSYIRAALINVFKLFPVRATKPIDGEDLLDVQINLHAFVINVFGFFDNLAWAFVHRHQLAVRFKDARKVGLFRAGFQKLLPTTFVEHLKSPNMQSWHQQYLIYYRDSLAHRIPLYVPPANWTASDGARWEELQTAKWRSIMSREFDAAEAMSKEQAELGTPCFSYLQTFLDDGLKKAVALHPQMIADSLTVTDSGTRFFTTWEDASNVDAN